MNGNFKEFVEFFKSCDNINDNLVFVTTEGLTNHFYDFKQESLHFIIALAKITDLKVILTLRNQCDFLNSYYKQGVLNPKIEKFLYGFAGSIEEFYENDRIRNLLDYEKLVNEYGKLVESENLGIVPNNVNNNGYFMKRLGVKNTENFVEVEVKNVSLSDEQ